MSQSPEAVIREWFEQLWNQKKIETIDRLFAADGIAHGLSGDVMKGPEGFRPFFSTFARRFPTSTSTSCAPLFKASSSWFTLT